MLNRVSKRYKLNRKSKIIGSNILVILLFILLGIYFKSWYKQIDYQPSKLKHIIT